MKRTTSQLIQTILALLFIFVFGNFIPTWSTVTRMGVQYLCIMVGWIWLSVLQGNLLLPSVVAMVGCLIPGYFTPESLVSATLGNTITVLMIFIFILVYIFQQSKTGDFLVRWLLSRKVVNGRPYLFTAFFLAPSSAPSVSSCWPSPSWAPSARWLESKRPTTGSGSCCCPWWLSPA